MEQVMGRFSIACWCLIATSLAHGEVPVTAREQVLAFDATELHLLAATAYADALKQNKQAHQLDHDALLLRRSRSVAGRLIAQAVRLKPEAADWKWELHVTASTEVDATSMAGGKLLLGASFIRSHALNDDELAILIGHEIGHAIAEHVREAATAVLKRNPKHAQRELGDVLAEMDYDMATYLQLMPLSRTQEIEADQIGVRLAAMAGFQPSAAIGFYRKLAEAEAGDQSSVFNTHASPHLRLRIAPALVADSRRFYQNAHAASGYAMR
jgi:predicted Zn-dependent protease